MWSICASVLFSSRSRVFNYVQIFQKHLWFPAGVWYVCFQPVNWIVDLTEKFDIWVNMLISFHPSDVLAFLMRRSVGAEKCTLAHWYTATAKFTSDLPKCCHLHSVPFTSNIWISKHAVRESFVLQKVEEGGVLWHLGTHLSFCAEKVEDTSCLEVGTGLPPF